MQLPSAIIFINPEISSQQQLQIKEQLFANEIIQDTEFDARLQADPNYVKVVHGQNLRILVIKNNFSDFTNREYADVVIFVKQGLMSIEKNKFGPPGATYPVRRFNLWDLLRSAGSDQVVILPSITTNTLTCQENQKGLGGIFKIISNSGLSACKPY
jgi:hypothetical protein